MTQQLELGLDTFGDVTADDAGQPLPAAQVLRNLVEQGVLADEVGIDFIGFGEHHRDDFAVSAPEVALAAVAARTSRIHLGSAVTVLSSDDPIRVFQRFSTLDAISNGRAEVILGRGSFTESFPLFGFELGDYETLFEEKLNLFAAVREQKPISWEGTTRAPLVNQSVYPAVENGLLKTWVGVGGSPESVVRTARYGFPLMLAIIGGDPARFAPYSDLYRRALDQFELPLQPIGVHSPGHVAPTDEEAREQLWPHYQAQMNRIGRERGWSPMGRAHFEQEAGPHGSLYVGSPETVAQKIAATVRTVGLQRFDLKYGNGPLPHSALMRSVELYGTQVIPRVRELLA
ncbi:LLM class flavin-dependent oxidoreductase [Herbiconiux sp. P15]|uniref:LLM class flavin-dependent oxidoreductase n=1 Tax=Herbiconiux liukaitaii TaxID=3342799 RepID=UPI0035B83772